MVERTWQLQEAKCRLSEVVTEALKGRPQVVTRRGEKAVVVLSYESYERLSGGERSLLDFLRRTPDSVGVLDLERDPRLPRDVPEFRDS